MKTYIVQKGDSLWLISQRYGISLDSLIAANPQISNPDLIDVGMVINVPANAGGGDSVTILPAPLSQIMSQSTTYTVIPGDTMWQIAKKNGVTLEALINANPQIQNPNSIQVGQQINLPSATVPTDYKYHKPKKGTKPTMSPTMPPLAEIEEIPLPIMEECPTPPPVTIVPLPAVELPSLELPPIELPPLPTACPFPPKHHKPTPPQKPIFKPTQAPPMVKPTMPPLPTRPPMQPVPYPQLQYPMPCRITVHHIHHFCGCCPNKYSAY